MADGGDVGEVMFVGQGGNDQIATNGDCRGDAAL